MTLYMTEGINEGLALHLNRTHSPTPRRARCVLNVHSPALLHRSKLGPLVRPELFTGGVVLKAVLIGMHGSKVALPRYNCSFLFGANSSV